MLKKTITYIVYFDVERTEDHYFKLSKPELVKLQGSVKGGYDVRLKGIVSELNGFNIMEFFEDLIRRSYGIKSEDGRRFMKSDEISRDFMETPAYEALFEELTTDDVAASEFIKAVLPPLNDAEKKALAEASK